MGYSSYSSASREDYTTKIKIKHTDEIFKQNIEKKIHQSMNPFGLTIRECKNSENHPEVLPIIIGLDVTGSMGHIPEDIVKDSLTHLIEGLLKESIDPAICFVAIGDQYSDRAPIQVGQFESDDIGLQTWLERTWLEGMGGGGDNESYALAWYLAQKYVVTDAWNKRKQKGIIITIGDEKTHPYISKNNITTIFDNVIQEDCDIKELLANVSKAWNIYHLHVNDASYPYSRRPEIFDFWTDLLGTKAILVQSYKDIAQTIVDIIKHNKTSIGNVKKPADLGKLNESTTML